MNFDLTPQADARNEQKKNYVAALLLLERLDYISLTIQNKQISVTDFFLFFFGSKLLSN